MVRVARNWGKSCAIWVGIDNMKLQAQQKVPTPHHARGFVDYANASPSPFHAVGMNSCNSQHDHCK